MNLDPFPLLRSRPRNPSGVGCYVFEGGILIEAAPELNCGVRKTLAGRPSSFDGGGLARKYLRLPSQHRRAE